MILSKQNNEELQKVLDIYQYDLGEKKLNSSIKETLIIKGEDIKNVTSTADCSCTYTSPNVINKETVEIDIIYKSTHILHTINRSVFINYTDKEQNFLKEIHLTGQIIN